MNNPQVKDNLKDKNKNNSFKSVVAMLIGRDVDLEKVECSIIELCSANQNHGRQTKYYRNILTPPAIRSFYKYMNFSQSICQSLINYRL